MKLAPMESVVARVRQAVDVQWLDACARKAAYMFGQEWSGSKNTSDLGDKYWPYYPDIAVQRLKVGQGRDILNTAYTSLSRLMSADPVPTYSGVDSITAELRAQFWLRRYKQGGCTGNGFASQVESCYMDFDNLGLGFLFVGVEPSYGADGGTYERASVQYVPLHDVVFDAWVRDPQESRYFAVRRFPSVEQAVKDYGSNVKKSAILKYKQSRSDWNSDEPHEVVPVVEYWDLGMPAKVKKDGSDTYPDCAPTKRILVGGVKGLCESYAEEHDLPVLPGAFFVNVMPPKIRRPMGRVDLMTATQEQKNQINQYIRRCLKAGPIDRFDVDGNDLNDVRQWMAGEGVAIKATKPITAQEKGWERTPGQEVPQSVFAFLQNVERQLNEDGNTTDNEQGNALGSARTLGEVQLVNQQANLNRAWAARQTAIGFRRLVRVFEEVARRWDTEPTTIDVYGTRVNINEPGKPESWTDQLYLEPADVLIDAQSLTPQDDQAKAARRNLELDTLAPFVGNGVNKAWFIKEKLKVANVKDIEDATAPEPAPDLMSLLSGQGQSPEMAGATGQVA